jgi:hypothetical protein
MNELTLLTENELMETKIGVTVTVSCAWVSFYPSHLQLAAIIFSLALEITSGAEYRCLCIRMLVNSNDTAYVTYRSADSIVIGTKQ